MSQPSEKVSSTSEAVHQRRRRCSRVYANGGSVRMECFTQLDMSHYGDDDLVGDGGPVGGHAKSRAVEQKIWGSRA
jgi:hypothetical protein